MLIQIDIDGTIVDTHSLWDKWLQENFNKSLNTIKTPTDKELDFWRNSSLYDSLMPFPNAIKVINKLSNKHEIVFVSSSFPEHIHSKENFLKRYFNKFKFIPTNHKDLIICDIHIDDFNGYLEKSKAKYKIKYKNNRNSPGKYPYLTWNEIYKFIKGIEDIEF